MKKVNVICLENLTINVQTTGAMIDPIVDTAASGAISFGKPEF